LQIKNWFLSKCLIFNEVFVGVGGVKCLKVIFCSFYIVLGQFKNVVLAPVDWIFCCAGVGRATVIDLVIEPRFRAVLCLMENP